MSHAILSPSSAQRWLSCTRSARLEQQFPDKAGRAAEEGTLAHSLGELLIRFKSNGITKAVYLEKLAAIQADGLYQDEMMEHADGYATFVLEQYAAAQSRTKDALLFLEEQLDLTDYVEEGFGTGDAIIIADKILDFTDLKYGKGVPVTAEENSQLKLYGLGALSRYDYMFDIQTVRMTIYQPRLDSISVFEISAADLKQWGKGVLIPRAALAFAGEGDFAVGSHCRFCKAKAVCRANADYNLELAKHDFKQPPLLNDEEVADILLRADNFNKWIAAVEEYALSEAVNNGKKWPLHKLVEGRSNRMYSDETLVANKLLAEGYKEDVLYTKKLLGITAMEKEIGKKSFTEHLTPLIVKPPGKLTLVPATDKRPEANGLEGAKLDFAEYIDN